MSEKDTIGSALTRLVVYVIVAVIILGILNWIFHYFIPETVARYPLLRSLAMISDFAPYIFIIVSLAIGWMIISSIASLLYAMSEPKYGASTAAAIRSLVKILGLGGLFASVAGMSLAGRRELPLAAL